MSPQLYPPDPAYRSAPPSIDDRGQTWSESGYHSHNGHERGPMPDSGSSGGSHPGGHPMYAPADRSRDSVRGGPEQDAYNDHHRAMSKPPPPSYAAPNYSASYQRYPSSSSRPDYESGADPYRGRPRMEEELPSGAGKRPRYGY